MNNATDTKAPVVGVDLGGTKILAAVVDPSGQILARCKKKTRAEKPHQEVIARIAECVRGAITESGLTLDRIAGLGIGAPGALNPQTGIIHLAPNLHWEEVPLQQILHKELGIPVYIGNDVNVGTLGECRVGAGVGMKNIVGIFIGTGIGGGLVFDGKVYEGAGFMAGEIGHIPMKNKGPVCGCGNRGCFEAVAGRLAIVRSIQKKAEKGKETMLTRELNGDFSRIKSRLLATAWKEKDPLTVKVLKKAARYIGRGIGVVIGLLNPEAVILGGGVIEAMDDAFLDAIRSYSEKYSFAPMFRDCRILRARLGDDAGILGAAFYARDRLLQK